MANRTIQSAAARDIRETFRRMGNDDEETVALIAGGHSFGQTTALAMRSLVGPRAGSRQHRESGLLAGRAIWLGQKRGDAITSGLEVTWSTTPTKWSNDFFKHLSATNGELTKSPAGANQWQPKNGAAAGTVPDAYDKSKASRASDADH